MTIEAGAAWITAVLLCALRLAPVWLLTPLMGAFSMPARVKVALLLALSATLTASLPLAPRGAIPQLGQLVLACAAELATGALFAFGILTAFAAVSLAGKLLDIQLGFSLGNVYDPVTRSQAPLLGSILGLLAMVMFFTTDAHHAVLRGLAYSLEKLPLGAMPAGVTPQLVMRQFGTIFTLGLGLAAPLVFLLFLLEVGLAVLSRNLPQMNIFVISVPVKIGLGLFVFSYIARQYEPVFGRIFGAIFTFWEAML
ncbi:MAG TPA: flagellar biosynthetic protein FliR [Burkholderiaceae bacterium]